MLDLGIDLGPRSGADVRFGLDPRDGHRLVVFRRGGGCLRVLGVILLGAGLALQAVGLLDGISWGALSGGLLLWLLSTLAVLAAVLLLPIPGWVQSSPSFDEIQLLAQGPRPASFWLGWLVVGACVNAVLVAGLLPVVAFAIRAVRKKRTRNRAA